MARRFLIFLVALLALAFAGCKPAEEPAAGGGAPEPAKTADSTEAKPAEPTETKAETKPAAELAKCQGCGMEVPKAELASHDGMMLCKQCIASHNH